MKNKNDIREKYIAYLGKKRDLGDDVTVEINAPIALEQVRVKAVLSALKWIMEPTPMELDEMEKEAERD